MKKALLIIFIGLVVFLAGCVKDKPKELQFKNDVVTIESYFVSNVAPYEKGETNIQFDLHNNGDQKIPYLEVDFFDIPGFEVVGSVSCPIGETEGKGKCVFKDTNALEPLDIRSITIQLKSTEELSSPTPHTMSFAVKYTYFGSREASIPVIDGQTRKQPLTKFRQSDSSLGPIALDIYPSIEREIITGDKTIKENWGIGGNNPLPFLTKFKFKHIGTLQEKIKDVNITVGDVRLSTSGLRIEETCDFCSIDSQQCRDKIADKDKLAINEVKLTSGPNRVVYKGPTQSVEEATKYIASVLENVWYFDKSSGEFSSYTPGSTTNSLAILHEGEEYSVTVNQDAVWTFPVYYSTKSTLVPFDILICTFRPNVNQPEYSATISASFTYKYEFIKSQNFVVQPLPE